MDLGGGQQPLFIVLLPRFCSQKSALDKRAQEKGVIGKLGEIRDRHLFYLSGTVTIWNSGNQEISPFLFYQVNHHYIPAHAYYLLSTPLDSEELSFYLNRKPKTVNRQLIVILAPSNPFFYVPLCILSTGLFL